MKFYQAYFLKRLLIFIFLNLNTYNAYSQNKSLPNLLRNTSELRQNYRAAVYNVDLLKLKILSAQSEEEKKEFEDQLKYHYEQSKLYDVEYSRSVEIILDLIKKSEHPESILKEMYKKLISYEEMILKDNDKPLEISSRISLLSYILNRFEEGQKHSSDSEIPHFLFLNMQEWNLLMVASAFASSNDLKNFKERLSQLDADFEKWKLQLNENAWKAYKASHINESIHSILILRGVYNSVHKPCHNALEWLNADDELNKTAFEIVDAQWSKLDSIQVREIKPYIGVQLSKEKYVYERVRQPYIRIENIDIFEPIFLPVSMIDGLIQEFSDEFFNIHDGLYEEKISREIAPTALDFVIQLSKKRPNEIQKSDIFPLFKDKKFIKNAKENALIYKFGPWELFMSDDYYVEIADGPRDSRFFNSHKKPSDSYDAMKKGVTENFVTQVRAFLKDGALSPELQMAGADDARVAYAKFISEPARNFRTWLINLMLLDLLEERVIDMNTFFEIHPMRGGSFAHQVSGGGEKKQSQIVEDETQIVINWLRHFWPRSEAIYFVDSIEKDYYQNLDAKSDTENYYYKLISKLLMTRLKNTSKFRSIFFKADDNVFLNHLLQQPRRILREAVYTDMLQKCNGIETDALRLVKLYGDKWNLSDRLDLLHAFRKFLKEQSRKSNPELHEFLEKKKIALKKDIELARKEFVLTINAIQGRL
jgi:hypothetical protein